MALDGLSRPLPVGGEGLSKRPQPSREVDATLSVFECSLKRFDP